MTSPLRAPLTAPAPRPASRPRLEVVRSPEPGRSVVPFFIGCVVLLLGALVAALILNTSMAVAAYQIHDMKIELNQLRETGADLSERADYLASPISLREMAGDLGMVPAEGTIYISVGSESILGSADETP